MMNVRTGIMTKRLALRITFGIVLVAGWVFVGMHFMWPPFVEPASEKCMVNLRHIDAAKEQWQLGARRFDWPLANEDQDTVNESGCNAYLPNSAIPQCPDGGSYSYGKTGEVPVCSIGTNKEPYKVRLSCLRSTWVNPSSHRAVRIDK
mgnify:CR=1 FL=1